MSRSAIIASKASQPHLVLFIPSLLSPKNLDKPIPDKPITLDRAGLEVSGF
jgi:hypothetical protein